MDEMMSAMDVKPEKSSTVKTASNITIGAMSKDDIPFNRSSIRRFRRGEIVFEAGVPTDNFARVHKGIICASTILADGREFIAEIIPQGGVIGELEVLRKQTLSVDYRAASDCELHFFEGRALRDLYAIDPRFQERILSKALARIWKLEFRIIANAGSSLQSRLASALLRLSCIFGQEGQCELTISQQDLAATLPASREKVNQCLRRLRENKIIEGTQGTIRILNRKALQECAGTTASMKY